MAAVERWEDRDFVVNEALLAHMKDEASNNGEGKFRYCLHERDESPIHQMIFTNKRELYSRPHSHNHDEFQIVVDGKMYVVYFSDEGKIDRWFYADDKTNKIFRINNGVIHYSIPISDTITIMEFKPGPFTSESNFYPDWAPMPEEVEMARKYQNEILDKVMRGRENKNE